MWFTKGRSKAKNHCNEERANLLLITYDQWRGDWGDPTEPVISMPCIEKIARNGWTAKRCYTSSPQCVPARLSWITGLRPNRIGVTKNKPAFLRCDSPSFIRRLRDKGWKTGIIGKTHWSDHSHSCDLKNNKTRLKNLGFNESIEIAGPRAMRIVECALTREWRRAGVYKKHMDDLDQRYKNGRHKSSWEVRETVLPNELYPDIWIANEGVKMMEKMPETRPWVLWISFVGPHEPFDTPKPWKGKNLWTNIPKAIETGEWIEKLSDETELKKIKKLWEGKISNEEIEKIRIDYADHLQLLDKQVDKIMTELAKRKDSERTAIAITSDHGEMLGDHQMLYKSTFLEPSIRVPFIYRPPIKGVKNKDTLFESSIEPIGLTKLIKKIATNLENGGSIEEIKKWTKAQKKAVAEYGEELMIVSKWIKVVFDKTGKPIWATDLKKDPSEQNNILTDKQRYKDNFKIINKLKAWAKKDIQNMKRRRSKKIVEFND